VGIRQKHLRKFSCVFLRNPKYIIFALPVAKYGNDCTKTRDILYLITVTSYRYLFVLPCAAFVCIVLAQYATYTTSTTHAAACDVPRGVVGTIFVVSLVSGDLLAEPVPSVHGIYHAYAEPTNALNAVRTQPADDALTTVERVNGSEVRS